MTQDEMKKSAAAAALDYIEHDIILGVGTGSTTDFFIEQLAKVKNKLDGAVASSVKTQQKLEALGIRVLDLNTAGVIPLYVDGADEANENLQLIKGGGGALTREKILAYAARKFVCIIDESKFVKVLGDFPLPIEVIPMARSLVAREIVKMGGSPEYREGFTTDNGNIILNIRQFPITKPFEMEEKINQIPGVVSNGICALRPADILLIGSSKGVETRKKA